MSTIAASISPKLLQLQTSNLVHGFVWAMPSRRTNFPESGRGLGYVTLQFLAYDRTYLQNYLSYRLQIWYTALYGQCRVGAQIIFPKCGRGLASRSVHWGT